MKLTIDTEALLQKLKKASLALQKKNILPVTSMFLFEVNNGLLKITSTDLERRVQLSTPVKSKENFRFCIPGKLITGTVELCREPEITFTTKEGSFVVEVKSGKNKYKLSGIDPNEFPVFNFPVSGNEITLQSSEFRRALKMAENLVDGNDIRENLRGLNISERNRKIEIVSATSNYAGKFIHSPRAIKSWEPALISPGLSKLIREAFGDKEILDITHDNKSIAIRSEETTVSGLLIDLKYPDTDIFFKSNEYDFDTVLNTMEVTDASNRLLLYSSEDKPYLGFKTNPENGNEIIVSGSDNFNNNFGEEVIVSKEAVNIDTHFNANFVEAIISLIDEPSFKFKYNNKYKKAYVCPELNNDSEPDCEFVFMAISQQPSL